MITQKNHFNPCFWTAFWNLAYLNSVRNNGKIDTRPRDQELFCLNLKSNKILKDKARNIFYQKRAGIADLTRENSLNYCARALPEFYAELKRDFDDSSSLFVDFENHFTCIEDSYKPTLEKVVINRAVKSIQEKTFLSVFICTQIIRHPNQWSEAVSIFRNEKRAKFELFLEYKQLLSNPKALMGLIMPFVISRWKLYRTKDMIFPLSDSPILERKSHVYLPLAPDLLLEIDLSKKALDRKVCSHQEKISFSQYKDFEKRTVENSSREIIFGQEDLLIKWQKSAAYKRQLEKIKQLSKPSL